MSKLTKISILIPVYNEAAFLPEILRRIEQVKIPLEREIILIESGSTDGSTQLVKQLCAEKNYIAIFEDQPRGKGSAIVKGMQVATGDLISIQDADLEYDPNDFPELLIPILENKTKFVLGSRHSGAKTWKIRKFDDDVWYAHVLNLGSIFFNTLFNLLYRQKLTDPQTMYKIFHRDCIQGITWRSKRFDLDWEIVGKLIRLGYHPIELPVSYCGRSKREGKKVKLWPDAWLALFAIIRFRFEPL